MFVHGNTARQAFHYVVSRLQNLHHHEEAAAMGFWLLHDLFGLNKQDVLFNENRLSESDLLRLRQAVKRLEQGEPLQYVLGHTEFMGLTIHVNPSVLIPRPETEEMVAKIMESEYQPLRVVDVCTGSGCIALALKHAYPRAEVIGVDLSAGALEVARQNAAHHQLDVEWLQADARLLKLDGQVDLVVSNPPYVPQREAESLAPHVREHEPALALYVPNEDVLAIARGVVVFAWNSLKGGGHLWFEFHRDYCSLLANELSSMGFADVEVWNDLNGNQRFVKAFKSNHSV